MSSLNPRRLALALLSAGALSLSMLAAGAAPAFAKSCSAGYVHAVIGGAQKCLRRGEFCAHRYAKQYRHYGFTCSYYVKGEYHLEPK
jgi:hypothetical protein